MRVSNTSANSQSKYLVKPCFKRMTVANDVSFSLLVASTSQPRLSQRHTRSHKSRNDLVHQAASDERVPTAHHEVMVQAVPASTGDVVRMMMVQRRKVQVVTSDLASPVVSAVAQVLLPHLRKLLSTTVTSSLLPTCNVLSTGAKEICNELNYVLPLA